jgi:hypothetical protein
MTMNMVAVPSAPQPGSPRNMKAAPRKNICHCDTEPQAIPVLDEAAFTIISVLFA